MNFEYGNVSLRKYLSTLPFLALKKKAHKHYFQMVSTEKAKEKLKDNYIAII